MKCPKCHKEGSRVVDSRPADNGHAIRRRRECSNCGYRFTTFERVEVTPLLVIKKNGNREEFNRQKILKGIVRATEKRPVGMDKITEIVDQVESKVRSVGSTEVSSQLIGEYIMGILADVDEVAYIRFASVYRQFKDMDAFKHELEELMARPLEAVRRRSLETDVIAACYIKIPGYLHRKPGYFRVRRVNNRDAARIPPNE